MLNKVRVRVNGKINLSLNITGKRGELHTLDSVVASVSVFDTITVRDRLDDRINLIFNADFSPQNNTVIKAVNALRKFLGTFGVDIVVDKQIPFAGGMGGSSADGAGVLVALDALFDLSKRGLDLGKVSSMVGADVKFLMEGGYARMTGTGDSVEKINSSRIIGVVYTECGGAETADVYKAFDALGGEKPVDNDKLVASLIGGEQLKLGNMLIRAAVSICPRIEMVMGEYARLGLAPNMTGSGSTVYALSNDPVRDAEHLNENGILSKFAFTQAKGITID